MLLGEVIRSWRVHKELSLKGTAEMFKIPPDVLRRFERGDNIKTEHFAVILRYVLK